MRVMLTLREADFQRLPTSILFGDLKICFAILGLKLFIASVFVVKEERKRVSNYDFDT